MSSRPAGDSSFGKSDYWDRVYHLTSGHLDPSPFAMHVEQSMLGKAERVLEIGCGNGRDAAYFARAGHSVVGLDASTVAIERCRATHKLVGLSFVAGMIQDCAELCSRNFDVIYSRFVVHAMTMAEEKSFLSRAFDLLAPGARLLTEARSINDSMALLGEAISSTERIHGHYRRFIAPADFAQRLDEAGFDVEDVVESKGLAVFGDEDPVVLRVIARRRLVR